MRLNGGTVAYLVPSVTVEISVKDVSDRRDD